jgi:hypothetical protein
MLVVREEGAVEQLVAVALDQDGGEGSAAVAPQRAETGRIHGHIHRCPIPFTLLPE